MARGKFLSLICVTHFLVSVFGDTYLQNPRGSNNRCNERSADRRSDNRIFDSQNNDKGGYNIGDLDTKAARTMNEQYSMKYFMSGKVGKSVLALQWTNQHGCGKNTRDDPTKLNCQIVLQYMCQPDEGEKLVTARDPLRTSIRDGTTTTQIRYRKPDSNESADKFKSRLRRHSRTDRGMHEPIQFRDKCQMRPRNSGLFIADQKVGSQATATRQNPKAQISGYECPEERDYYPYWHATDWKDIAILVEDERRCAKLKKNSFNVHPYEECVENFPGGGGESHYSTAETKAKCEALNPKGTWREYNNYLEKVVKDDGSDFEDLEECQNVAVKKGIDKSKVSYAYAIYGTKRECLVNLEEPICRRANYTRVNHLGNADGDSLGTTNFEWELPYFPSGVSQRCVLRLRYNISTEDYPANTNASANNKGKNEDEVLISNDPLVSVGLPNDQKLQLAINTAQFGRTFQDRSHVFYLRPRPKELGEDRVYNLNVRGKRGNIVQTYPATEYDFVPNDLVINKKDLVHFQWTGSNSHNNGNPSDDGQTGDDGEGKGGTDRTNVLGIPDRGKNFFYPMEHPSTFSNNLEGVWTPKKVADAIAPNKMNKYDIGLYMGSAGYFKCYKDCGRDSLESKKAMDDQLDNAPASFEGFVGKFKQAKTHVIGCSRNNNFSNRSQKGQITVKD